MTVNKINVAECDGCGKRVETNDKVGRLPETWHEIQFNSLQTCVVVHGCSVDCVITAVKRTLAPEKKIEITDI